MTNLFLIAFFGFNVDGNETLKRTTAFIKQKYKILQFYWWQMSLFLITEPAINLNKEPSLNLNKVAKFFQVSAHVHLCHPQHLKTIA